MVTHLSTNRARRRVTSSILSNYAVTINASHHTLHLRVVRRSEDGNLVVDAGHVEFSLKYHQHNAGDAEHQRVVRQSLAFGKQYVTSRHSHAEIRSRRERSLLLRVGGDGRVRGAGRDRRLAVAVARSVVVRHDPVHQHAAAATAANLRSDCGTPPIDSSSNAMNLACDEELTDS